MNIILPFPERRISSVVSPAEASYPSLRVDPIARATLGLMFTLPEGFAESPACCAEEMDDPENLEAASTSCRPKKDDFEDELLELLKSIPKLLVHAPITSGSLPVRIRGSSDLNGDKDMELLLSFSFFTFCNGNSGVPNSVLTILCRLLLLV